MRRNGVQWVAAVLAVILAAALGVMIVRHVQAERKREAALAAMLEQAEPVKRELDQLRRELSERERASKEDTRSACLMTGYRIERRSDIELAVRHAEQFDFTPVFVIDTTLENWRELLDALRDVPGEIVLSASPCTAGNVEAAEIREALSESERASKDSGFFLLRNTDDTPENLALIAGAGYTGCLRHSEAGENTVLDSGLVTLSYSQIKSGDFSVKKRLDSAIDSAHALLFVFDMEAVRDGALTEADIADALSLIVAARSEHDLAAVTLTEACERVRTWTEKSIMSRKAFEAYAAEQQQKIDALEAQLDAIYAQWDQGGAP